MADQTLQQFYEDFETLPKLISMLALSVADAQTRLDEGYLKSLAKLAQIAGALRGSGIDLGATGFMDIFKAMGPSRYQFTETVVDVRADLRMSTGKEFQIGGSLGVATPMFAVAVNASYLQRTAADFQASALIHCVIHAISSDAAVMQKLLDAAPKLDPSTLPPADVGRGILDGWLALTGLRIVEDVLPTGKAGKEYVAHVHAAGGSEPYDFAAIEAARLPKGLKADAVKGGRSLDIIGTLAADSAGTYSIDVTATDKSAEPKSVTKTLKIVVG